MELNGPLVLEIAREIWTSMLGMDLEESGSADQFVSSGAQYLEGTVQISGDRELAVTIRLPLELAQRATSRLLEMDLTDISDALAIDAVGEIANMVAGSLKNRINASFRLSLPTVILGHDFNIHVPGTTKLLDLILSSATMPAFIAVHERRAH